MPNSAGGAYCLTTFTPILPGRGPALRALLASLPRQEQSPFAQVGSTHFARWVVIDSLVYEGKPQTPDFLEFPQLLFTCVFDGDLDPFLNRLCLQQAAVLDAVYRNCVAYPGARPPDRFRAYVHRNQIDADFFLAGYPRATVADVRASMEVRAAFVEFTHQSQHLDAVALYRAFQKRFGIGMPPISAPALEATDASR